MKFFEGDIQNAISKRKIFSSAFIVFVEAKDDESAKFRKVLEEENLISAKDYIAFRVIFQSESFKHFSAIYGAVPVPSLFIIGNDGEPIRVLSTFESRNELYKLIKEALEIHKNDSLAQKRNERSKIDNFTQILLKLSRDSLQVKEPFQMIIPFPRKVFTAEEEGKTLVELELCPTSTILIVTPDKFKLLPPQFLSNILIAVFTGLCQFVESFKRWLLSFISRRSVRSN
ncbi:ubx domain-containing protein, putative [Pediculus humanus corporis]|uniref:UBX domain-containing protein 4 n=1 Tax=Pediculus humanus subsp. corporis TaxID=121224 RepID=E0VQJ1_PEDHC|nr:ubx domain-containing protein, putative [Pediculus humanus corporis]EEB15647.1 ubx domain-containing protein, putative [Pediculus humanus corporis]